MAVGHEKQSCALAQVPPRKAAEFLVGFSSRFDV